MHPDLTWNTTVKRRSRKLTARKGRVEATKAVSKSEKLGVVLGKHSKDDVEHVPIKKQRSLGQSLSPSPPPLQTSQRRVQDASRLGPRRNPTDRQKPNRSDASSVKGHEMISNTFLEKFGRFEDFSGIKILADVACSRAIRDGINHVNGKLFTEERILQEPNLEASVSSLSVVSSSHNDVVPEDEPKNTTFQGDHDIVSNKVIADEKISKIRDDRLHWDLNVPMEEWEKPCDFVNDVCAELVQDDDASGTSRNALDVCEFEREAEKYKEEHVSNEVVLPNAIMNISLPLDSIDLHVSSDGSKVAENSTESSWNRNECSFTIVDTSPNCLISNTSDTKVSTQVVTTNALLNISASLHNVKPHNVESLESSEKSGSMSSYYDNVNQSADYDTSDVELYANKSSKIEDTSNTSNEGVELYANKSSEKDIISTLTPVRDIDSAYKNSNIPQEVNEFTSFEVAKIYNNSSICRNELPLIIVEDPSGDNYGGSDISLKDKEDEQISADYQADYESQIEDGELRELYPCREDIDECEEVNQLDYDESKEEKTCGSSESIDNKTKVVNESILETDYVNKNVHATEQTFRRNANGLKSGTSRMSDGEHMNQASRNRSDNFDDSYVRDESVVVSDRFKAKAKNRLPLRLRGRSPKGGHSPIYNDPYFVHSRLRRPTETPGYMMGLDNTVPPGIGISRFDSHTRKEFFNPSSNRAYHNLERRTRPVDRDYNYDGGMHSGISPIRETSPDRNSYRRYQQGVNRPQPENITEYYGRTPQRSIKRDRSISPPVGGRHYYARPYNKSQPRFQNRSPTLRRHSGLPNFRQDDKEGVNMFFQKRFVADGEDDDNFVSLPRNQYFVHRDNTRWFDERNSTMSTFKNKKSSPGKMVHQNVNQKFDPERYFQRGDPGTTRPRRFQGILGGGPCKYEGIDNDKYEKKYDMIHRPRRHNTDVPARRFNDDAEDSHVVNDS